MQHISKQTHAFTLVELIVVITILVILGTIAFVSLGDYAGTARDGSRVSDLANLSKGLDLFYVKNGSFPDPSGAISVTYSGAAIWRQGTAGESIANIILSAGAKLSKMPVDPLSKAEYAYSITTETKEYSLRGDYE